MKPRYIDCMRLLLLAEYFDIPHTNIYNNFFKGQQLAIQWQGMQVLSYQTYRWLVVALYPILHQSLTMRTLS